jgi:hypothetical protein
VRDDPGALSGHRQFNEHVVVRVAKERSPEKEYVLLFCHQAQVVDENFNVLRRKAALQVPEEYGFVLDDEGHGDSDLEIPRPEMLEKCIRRPVPRSPRGHENGCIQDDAHLPMVSQAILPCKEDDHHTRAHRRTTNLNSGSFARPRVAHRPPG